MNKILIALLILATCYGASGQGFGTIRAKNNAGTYGEIKRTDDAQKVIDSAAIVQITKAADSAYHRIMFKISQLPTVSLDSSTTRISVKVSQLPSIALAANSGVDIGDVTINNASGGSAVNIQDGGNSITVDANTLPLPTGAATESSLSAVRTATELIDDAVNTTGSAVTAKAIGVSGTDGTNARMLATNSSGHVRLDSAYTRSEIKIGSIPLTNTQYQEAATTSPGVGNLVFGRYLTTPPSLSDGRMNALQLDASGNLKVTGSFSATAGATVIYDSTVTASSMTVTNLNSVANSATVGWQSIRVSNVSAKASDYKISVKLTMANTAPANDKAVYVYVCPHYTTDGGSTWLAASQGTTTLPTGSEGATTIASPNNLRLLGVLSYTTQNMVLQDNFLISNAFGNVMPDGFQIIIIDYSGAAISASGNSVHYSPIYKTQR